MQNLLFCIPKAAVLHAKSVGFASQKSRFRNVKAQLSLFNRIIFTKQRLFQAVITKYKGVPKLTFDTPFLKILHFLNIVQYKYYSGHKQCAFVRSPYPVCTVPLSTYKL
ncbi:hypothetical protein CTM55_08010 [Prevotella intermedia]|nr:hypothetical protein CTM55_08010 [Prevotella intermedia]